ncbi:hypothetical protein SCARD494_02631 [Seiridium cardinale]
MSSRQFDEDKCRNVLVRYCGHIPRNYQYKDGVQQVFLVLRDHLGDETLDLAGGVLYELIEMDCEHTHDPGAAFQRWRHDHMSRHVSPPPIPGQMQATDTNQSDLELPHVPHMTTITPSIVPTERLARWRAKHSERYPFVLSDSKPLEGRSSAERSCIRNRKPWLIDNTFYVSSQTEGTLPLTTPNAKEFHEMHWRVHSGDSGRLVHERQISVSVSDCCSLSSPLESTTKSSMETTSRASRSRSSLFNKISGCQVPNAIFARKHLLVDGDHSFPSHLSVSFMPIAESKATETMQEAADSDQRFRGPFTPQLGYDGGLDYRWTIGNPSATAQDNEWNQASRRRSTSPDQTEEISGPTDVDTYSRVKRRGFHLGYNSALDWLSSCQQLPSTSTLNHTNVNTNPTSASHGSAHSAQKTRRRWRNPLHLENVHFVMPDTVESHNPSSNRKTTIVQVSPSPPSLPAVRRLPSITDDMAHRLEPKPSYLSNTSTLIHADGLLVDE